MTHQELIDHKNTLNGKIKDISKTIDYFKSIGVTSLINTLEDTRDFLIQSVYIINTELYKKEEEK